MSLRAKFLLSLALISALITTAVLLVVRYRVQLRVRQELTLALNTSGETFDQLQRQREVTLERSAALLAALPPVKALMTSGDPATIQDASATFWSLAGSQVFVMAGTSGTVLAFHTTVPAFPRAAAEAAIARFESTGVTRDWWFGGGHLFQVFLQPISFGAPDSGSSLGVLAVGYEVNDDIARDVSHAAASEVAFAYGDRIVVGTVAAHDRDALAAATLADARSPGTPREVRLGSESFLANTVPISHDTTPVVTLIVLKSFDEATAFLNSLNQWIVGIGAAGVIAGSLLVFLVSTTFTRPLARLVSGVRALEEGDYNYPLDARGGDEVAEVTAAFNRMRQQLQATQRRLLETERMATIGRMANTISHDLRHPLTAIQAYAEFLSEPGLTEAQRKDFFQEIRIAVNHMTDEINQLLGFSHERQALQRVDGRIDEVVDRAIKTVKALPEYERLVLTSAVDADCRAWLDPGKVERVLLNLLFNAAEAVSPEHGRIEVTCDRHADSVDLRITDNGPGIPPEIVGTLFEPFVSHGKQKGTGLGLTVVQNVMLQHGGAALVEHTGADGTTFLLRFPAATDAQRRG
ncbi:MAG: HAMP domain-containing sensor histidine kinase [Vicinamibacterales bacterium]